jgi:lauroyl/myristoyl acyltransferase
MVRETDDRLRLVIEPELELVRSAKGMSEIKENTARVTRWLENTVRTYPDQWNWMNIHWLDKRHDPALSGDEGVQRASY